MEDNTETKKGGCLKMVLAGIGLLLLLSPLNPFVEWRDRDEGLLTNSSLVVLTAMLAVYGYFVFRWFDNK